MDRHTSLLYVVYILIVVMIIVFFVSVFNDNDYKLGFYNYIDSYVNNKCYPIKKKWSKLLKWKDVNNSTIDFYSVKEKLPSQYS
jgi:hypothetical protein